MAKTLKKRGQRGIEPRTSRTQSENHTTRPLSLKNRYTNSNIKNMEFTHVSLILKRLSKFSVFVPLAPKARIIPLDHCPFTNSNIGVQRVNFEKWLSKPRTSRTLSENHTTRPLSLRKDIRTRISKTTESINVSLILKRLSKFSVCGKNF